MAQSKYTLLIPCNSKTENTDRAINQILIASNITEFYNDNCDFSWILHVLRNFCVNIAKLLVPNLYFISTHFNCPSLLSSTTKNI
jgi:hypothetical protein